MTTVTRKALLGMIQDVLESRSSYCLDNKEEIGLLVEAIDHAMNPFIGCKFIEGPASPWDINEPMGKKIWRILVDTCGAYEDSERRLEESYFLAHITTLRRESTEFRFQGKLGFGGKFWVNGGQWYVNCYPEDMTIEKQSIIDMANVQLELLLRKHVAGDPT